MAYYLTQKKAIKEEQMDKKLISNYTKFERTKHSNQKAETVRLDTKNSTLCCLQETHFRFKDKV